MANRHIDLMIDNSTAEKVETMKKWCEEHEIQYFPRYDRENGKLHYFWIYGSTQEYNAIQAFMGNELRQTDYAALGNIYDCSDEELKTFKDIQADTSALQARENQLNEKFLKFIMVVKDVKVLEEIRKYNLTDFCRELINIRMHVLKGEKSDYELCLENLLREQENKKGAASEA